MMSFEELIQLYDYYSRMSLVYLNTDWDVYNDNKNRFCQFDLLARGVAREIERR